MGESLRPFSPLSRDTGFTGSGGMVSRSSARQPSVSWQPSPPSVLSLEPGPARPGFYPSCRGSYRHYPACSLTVGVCQSERKRGKCSRAGWGLPSGAECLLAHPSRSLVAVADLGDWLRRSPGQILKLGNLPTFCWLSEMAWPGKI